MPGRGLRSAARTRKRMIDKTALTAFIEGRLENTDLYLVDVEVTPANEIRVEIDSDASVDIDRCVELTREIEQEFDRDVEDYELEVGSAGLTSPFKVLRQYEKNIGNEVEVLAADGRKYRGCFAKRAPRLSPWYARRRGSPRAPSVRWWRRWSVSSPTEM